ncbi:CpaF family protein [Arabiibacter massiliensis]|uniref:CpaF family protein n=1 Tax=Arabiibacter massiliensis TaxID=1870985 RepID=UPI0009BB5AF7|nr:CpaF family protein [Arabiibacter massiliensis]
MDKALERALKTAVREEASLRLRSEQADPSKVESLIGGLVGQVALELGVDLRPYEVEPLARCIVDDFLRYGPLQPLLEDPSVTEIMVNGGGVDARDPALPFFAPVVYVERAGLIEYRPDVVFDDADHLRRIINKIAEQAGMRCDETHAMGCAMLPGGRARATYVVPPIAPDGPALNLRTFSDGMLGMEDLLDAGALPPVVAEFLCAAVQARCPIVVSGGTGSGKTTLLGALSGFIPAGERVITIEDTPELRLRAAHVERMQTREANVEGEGAVSMRDLVALSLRRRPDRIIVGECRGAEAYDMLQAMQTDHPGSMTTIHANDPANALSRLRTMVGYADGDLSREVVAQQIAESLQGGLIVHVERLRDGTRKVTSVVSVDPLPEGGTVIPRAELFSFDIEGVDPDGWIVGAWRSCGVQPQRIKERMREAGVRFDPAWFFGS